MKHKILILFLIALRFTAFAQEPKLMLPVGHTAIVRNFQMSADENYAVSEAGGIVKLWDLKAGKIIVNLEATAGQSVHIGKDLSKIITSKRNQYGRIIITIWDVLKATALNSVEVGDDFESIQYSNDGKKAFLVTGVYDEYISFVTLDLVTNELLKYSPLPKKTTKYSFIKENTQLVTFSALDSTVRIQNTSDAKILKSFKINTNELTGFACSDKGQVAILGADSTVRLYEMETGHLLKAFKTPDFGDIKYSPDGKLISLFGTTDNISIIDAASGKQLFSLTGHTALVTRLSFSADSKKILTSAHDNTLKIWNTANGKLLNNLEVPNSPFYFAEFSPGGKKLIASNFDNSVKIWDLNTSKVIENLFGHTYYVRQTALSNDNEHLLAAYQDRDATIWNFRSGRIERTLERSRNLSGFAYCKSGSRAYANTGDTVKIWDTVTGKLLLTNANKNAVSGDNVIYTDFWVNNDGSKLTAYNIETKTVDVWDVDTRKLLYSVPCASLCYGLEFSHDGQKALILNKDGSLSLFDLQSGQILRKIIEKGFNSYMKAGFNVNDSRLFVYYYNGLKLFDTETYKIVADVNIIQQGSYNVITEFSPDGKKLTFTGSNSDLKMINAENGERAGEIVNESVGTIFSPPDIPTKVKYSADGSRLFVQKNLGAIEIYDANTLKRLFIQKSPLILEEQPQFIMGSMAWKYDQMNISNDLKRLVFNKGSIIQLFDTETMQLIDNYVAVDSLDYLVVDRFNRYDGSEAARKFLYFVCDKDIIGLDQVKDQLWVPNLASRIMSGETINAPKLSDLEICGLTPEVEELKDKTNEFHFKITPRRGGLGETVLFVNDIEIKRFSPAQLVKKGDIYELTVPKQELQSYFIPGKKNLVAVKAYTNKNDISSRGIEIINDAPAGQTGAPNLYAVFVGVGDYKGDDMDLNYAAKDAIDISKALGASARKLLNTDGREHVFLYNLSTAKSRDLLPEKAAIKNTLLEIGKKATANDIIFVFFAGHGVMEGTQKQFYFLTADASLASATSAPAQVGISTQELSEWMKPQNIKAQKRVLVFDACNSGQAINELIKGDQVAVRGDEHAQQVKAIEKLNEKSGLFILSASASNQSAYEMSRYEQGMLTYALLKAIKEQPDILEDQKYLNVGRWFSAAEKTVTDLVSATGKRQQPQMVSAGNFNIGMVDNDIVKNIFLGGEKPLFARSDFRNADKKIDDLRLRNLIDNEMSAISSRGTDNAIVYRPEYEGADAYGLTGDYTVTGNNIKVSVILTKGTDIIYQYNVDGNTSKMQVLAADVAAKAIAWIKKK